MFSFDKSAINLHLFANKMIRLTFRKKTIKTVKKNTKRYV